MDGGPPVIEHAVSDGIAVITIANPGRFNALTIGMWIELERIVTELSADPRVLVLVIRGAGDDFSSGFDIHDLPDTDPDRFHPVHLAAEQAIATCPKPVLAAIRGTCVGGGCEIAVAADLRYADPGARFGVTPSRLGIVYPSQPTRRLVELIGVGEARRLLFLGELMDASWALRVGLVSEVVAEGEDVIDRTMAVARLLTTRSQISIAAAKHYTAGGAERSWPATDYAEGVRAFRERRSPGFPSAR
ncbi:enoyl-CoA hydratase [Enemella evansiae]|nr:enoyl-CoA hydratase [Enemella evansiae]